MATTISFKSWLVEQERLEEAWGWETTKKSFGAVGRGTQNYLLKPMWQWLERHAPRTAKILAWMGRGLKWLVWDKFIESIICMVRGPKKETQKLEEVKQAVDEILGDFKDKTEEEMTNAIEKMISDAKEVKSEEDKADFKKKHGPLLKVLIGVGTFMHIIPMAKSVSKGAMEIHHGQQEALKGNFYQGIKKIGLGAGLIIHTITIGGIISGLLPKVLAFLSEIGMGHYLLPLASYLALGTGGAYGVLLISKGILNCLQDKQNAASVLAAAMIYALEPEHAIAMKKAHAAVSGKKEDQPSQPKDEEKPSAPEFSKTPVVQQRPQINPQRRFARPGLEQLPDR
jgi:hypothetical protein